ncbi:MAG TPA: hypothetical protein VL285_07665 [Bryobacteraceae bacterium]|nr:hypothetical protein [Bryobacteraceae bacterium]
MADIILILMLVLALALWLAAAPPDFEFFTKRVEPIFLKARQGAARCYDCHSLDSNKSLFHLEGTRADGTWSRAQSRRNFENALKLVDVARPLSSRLLLHPLGESAGGDPFHTGGKFWQSKDDPEWRTLADWVQGGKAARDDRAK